MLKALWVITGGWGTYILKAFSERFGFDVLESRKFKLSVKIKATGTPLEVSLLYPFGWWAMIYTSAWGFQRCSVRQIGRCESLNTWTGHRTGSTFFCVYVRTNLKQTTEIGACIGKRNPPWNGKAL